MQTNRDNRDTRVDGDTRADHIICTQFFSWTPIFIGGLVAFGLGFLLDVFSKGIGLSLYTTNTTGATVLAVGGLLGVLIGAVATMFTAGFAAGFFAGPTCGNRNYGAVYGFVAWCLGLLLMALFASFLASETQNRYTPYSYTNTANANTTTNEVASTSRNVATKVNPITDAGDTQGEKNVRALGALSLAFFVIFFVGAVSASFGGFAGFHYWYRCKNCN